MTTTAASRFAARSPRVLVLSRNYPTALAPTRGLWVERLVRASTGVVEPTVIAPLAFVLGTTNVREAVQHARIPRFSIRAEIDVWHPRVPSGLVQASHALDAMLDFPFVCRVADRLHQTRPFDLIHAHFVYPEGVIAARLGKRYGIPVVTTEHSFWQPWLDSHARVRRQVLSALPGIDLVTTVSEHLRAQVAQIAKETTRTMILPNVVDDQTFVLRRPNERRHSEQILFVGLVRHVKGLDVLVRAMERLAARRPAARLVVIGDGWRRGYRRERAAVEKLVQELRLGDRITFLGSANPPEVARMMRESAAVVVPSRRESFCSVVVEALASGVPVVATRCGGPEELLSDDTGVLVPVDDPAALAAGIEQVSTHQDQYDASRLREHAVSRYGWDASRRRLEQVYAQALAIHEAAAERPAMIVRSAVPFAPADRMAAVKFSEYGSIRNRG